MSKAIRKYVDSMIMPVFLSESLPKLGYNRKRVCETGRYFVVRLHTFPPVFTEVPPLPVRLSLIGDSLELL